MEIFAMISENTASCLKCSVSLFAIEQRWCSC